MGLLWADCLSPGGRLCDSWRQVEGFLEQGCLIPRGSLSDFWTKGCKIPGAR